MCYRFFPFGVGRFIIGVGYGGVRVSYLGVNFDSFALKKRLRRRENGCIRGLCRSNICHFWPKKGAEKA